MSKYDYETKTESLKAKLEIVWSEVNRVIADFLFRIELFVEFFPTKYSPCSKRFMLNISLFKHPHISTKYAGASLDVVLLL